MRAKIELRGEVLIAELEDGRQLSHVDAIELAKLLWASGVTADEVTAVDWHEDVDRAPTGGQKIAIFGYLRRETQLFD